MWKVYLKETLPSLVRGAAITFVTLFGYSAMAGTVGAGGLGDIAIRYGYQRFQTDVMIFAVLLCVVLVIVFQAIGDVTARKIDKRRRQNTQERGVPRDVVDHARMGSQEALEHTAEPTQARHAGKTPRT